MKKAKYDSFSFDYDKLNVTSQPNHKFNALDRLKVFKMLLLAEP